MRRTVIISAVAGAIVFLSAAVGPVIYVPERFADAVRFVALAVAGFGIVLEAALVGAVGRLNLHPETQRSVEPLRWIAVAGFGFCIYLGLDMADRIVSDQGLSFRFPLSVFVLTAFIGGVYRLHCNVARLVERAEFTGATVRVVATDTSKPGPDIELNEPEPTPPAEPGGK